MARRKKTTQRKRAKRTPNLRAALEAEAKAYAAFERSMAKTVRAWLKLETAAAAVRRHEKAEAKRAEGEAKWERRFAELELQRINNDLHKIGKGAQ